MGKQNKELIGNINKLNKMTEITKEHGNHEELWNIKRQV